MMAGVWLLVGMFIGGAIALAAVWIGLRANDRTAEERLLDHMRRGRFAHYPPPLRECPPAPPPTARSPGKEHSESVGVRRASMEDVQ